MEQCLFSYFCDALISQQTIAKSTIQILLQLLSLFPVVFDFQQALPFSATACGHGIGQSKGDQLSQSREIAMGKKATFMPAKKAQCFFSGCQRALPAVFPRDQLAQMLSFGSQCHFSSAVPEAGAPP